MVDLNTLTDEKKKEIEKARFRVGDALDKHKKWRFIFICTCISFVAILAILAKLQNAAIITEDSLGSMGLPVFIIVIIIGFKYSFVRSELNTATRILQGLLEMTDEEVWNS